MDSHQQFATLLEGTKPWLALAPMQDVTDRAFWELMRLYGGADVYVTEYFRVHATSNLQKTILRSVTDNPTQRPAIAQMIGCDVPALVRTAKELQQYPIVGIDLNLGCPAPIVYKKRAGGGLLREPETIDTILAALRDSVEIKFSVKTRIGFDDAAIFDRLLSVFAKRSIDLLTVHGRTVKERYSSEVHYDMIARAVEAMPCPVLANGNVFSAQQASRVLEKTNAAGLMVGRAAIRNPWIFQQIRQHLAHADGFQPRGIDVLAYIRQLFDAVRLPSFRESSHVQKMKRYMNYIGEGVDATGQFLHQIRRVKSESDFFSVCRAFLDHDRPMSLEPLIKSA